jgi:steroid delta-isomerase-like uncharacterized protein
MTVNRISRFVAMALLLSGCATSSNVINHNKQIVRLYFQEWANQGNAQIADKLIAANVVLHSPRTTLTSLDQYKASMATFHAAFPDLHFTIDDQIGEGDRIVVRWTLRGTQRGEFQGRPGSSKPVTVIGTSTFRLAQGKIQEIWLSMDRLGMMEQLGWLPAQSQPTK